MRRSTQFILAGLLTLAGLCAPAPAQGTAANGQAAELWEAMEHELALAMLDSLPDDSLSHSQRCRNLMMAGDHYLAVVSAYDFLARWPASPLALDCQWQLANSLQQLGFYRDALDNFQELAARDTLLSDIACLHQAQCLNSLGQSRRADGILDSLRRRRMSFGDDLNLADDGRRWQPGPAQTGDGATVATNRTFRRINRAIGQRKHQYALALLRKFLKAEPRSPYRGQAQYLIGKCYERQGQLDKAADAYLAVETLQPGSALADDGLYRAGWCGYKRRLPAACLKTWQGLQERYPNSDYCDAALYWGHRVLSEMGDSVQARQQLELLMAGHQFSYYWWRVRNGNGNGDANGASAESLAATAGSVPWAEADFQGWLRDHRQFRQALRLAEIGLADDAKEVIEILKGVVGNDVAALYHLALAYHRVGMDPQAIFYAKRAYGLWMGPKPRQLLEVLYPRRYVHSISRNARDNRLEPALVLAVMRQESKFVAQAKSRAGARGLMQIMPKTGKRLMGIKKFRADTLYHPGTSIYYGTKFLGRLLDQYDGSVVRALAAYNAGPMRVKEWMKNPRCRDDDFLVEEITVLETRNYIKKVMEGYYIYKMLLERR